MTNIELISALISMIKDEKNNHVALPLEAEVLAEFADLGVGGNVTSSIKDVRVEDGRIILVTDHAI